MKDWPESLTEHDLVTSPGVFKKEKKERKTGLLNKRRLQNGPDLYGKQWQSVLKTSVKYEYMSQAFRQE